MVKNVLCLLIFLSTLGALATDLEEEYKKSLNILNEKSLQEAKGEALNFLSAAKNEESDFYLIKAYYLLGYISKEMNEYGDAVIFYLEGARFAEVSHQLESKRDLVSIYKNLAVIMGDYSHFELAHKFINKGISVAKSLGDQKQVTSLLTNRVHELLNENKCQEVLDEIDNLITNYPIDSARLFSLKNKAGRAYQILGNQALAIEAYEFIVEHGQNKNKVIYANALHNMGNVHYQNHDYTEALGSFERSIDYKRKSQQYGLLIHSLHDAAETSIHLKDYDQALIYLKEAEALDTVGTHLDSHAIYKLMSEAYYLKNETESALKYNYIYSQKLEEFIAEQKKIEELDKKYNIQLLTERYFDLLAATQKQEQTEYFAKIGAGSLMGIFLLIILNIYYRQYRVKRSIKEEIRKIEMLDI